MYFDVAMPVTLFTFTLVAIFLERKVEKKLKSTFEERELGLKEAVVLVASICIMVSLIVLIPGTFVMMIYLFSYSMLLFIFTYLFSDMRRFWARSFLWTFLASSFLAATLSVLSYRTDESVAYGGLALYVLSASAFIGLLCEELRTDRSERWYLAVLPPALFVSLYLFFSRTPFWFPYLLDLFGGLFAVLIVLYLGSLFRWKSTLAFVGLLTVVDVILVLYTGSMVSAARHVSGLLLPISVSLPTVPSVLTEWGVLYMSLGLGDFFFAGLICTQSAKRFGRWFGLWSAAAMSLSFFVFEVLMLNLVVEAFPGTLMIGSGWLPLLWGQLKKRKA